jgi:hypothetical protein
LIPSSRRKRTAFGIAAQPRTSRVTRAGEDRAHQSVREPLRAEAAERLANACPTVEEKLIVGTLLDTGLRVSDLCSPTLDSVPWQQRTLRVAGKGALTARGASHGSSRCRHGFVRSWNRISP